MRDDQEKLQDILEAIERIDRYAVQGRQVFEQNELIQTWVIQNRLDTPIAFVKFRL